MDDDIDEIMGREDLDLDNTEEANANAEHTTDGTEEETTENKVEKIPKEKKKPKYQMTVEERKRLKRKKLNRQKKSVRRTGDTAKTSNC